MIVTEGSDKFTNLVNAWNNFDSKPFNEWVIDVSDNYFLSGLTLKMAASFLDTQPAELQAVINLAGLEEEKGLIKPNYLQWWEYAELIYLKLKL